MQHFCPSIIQHYSISLRTLQGQVIDDVDWTRVLVKHRLTNNRKHFNMSREALYEAFKIPGKSMARLYKHHNHDTR